jgi:hypothetical protein
VGIPDTEGIGVIETGVADGGMASDDMGGIPFVNVSRSMVRPPWPSGECAAEAALMRRV